MHIADKLDVLAAEARYDLSCACGNSGVRTRGAAGRWIYPAALPDGKVVRMLKILLSNACTYDCAFCGQRQGYRSRRTRLRPEELAASFMELRRHGKVDGLFLSSSIDGDPRQCMDRMLTTLELLRFRHGYRGWIHCKILPGSGQDQVERAAQLATRLSLNLETATTESLKAIAPRKGIAGGVLERMSWISDLIGRGETRCRGQTTQFIVGAGEDTDSQFIHTAARLYEGLGLSRVYFSAFQPVNGTPLEERAPASLDREHRLYQADFLLRKYGFSAEEIVFDDSGNLPVGTDPKTAWAKLHPELFPVEVNTASRAELLRVPGVGPVSARRILAARRIGKIRSITEIAALGISPGRSGPYLLIDGRTMGRAKGSQLALW